MIAKRKTAIGRTAMIVSRGRRFIATVIDAVAREPHRAKRVRVQSQGALHGNVLQPNEYTLIEYL